MISILLHRRISTYTNELTSTFIYLLSINVPRIYANNGSTFITKTHFYVDKAMKCASVPCYIGFESNTNTDFIFQDH